MSDIAEKWGTKIAERGFAQVPNYLLLLNQFLVKEKRLSPVELLVLIQLVGSWWKKDAMPFPSMTTLANRCGVSSRQIQRAINRLEGDGLIRRVNRRNQGVVSSNAYDMAPLVTLLNIVAEAFPNEFPRNVDRATVEAISARIQAVAPATAEQLADDTFVDLTAPGLAEDITMSKATKRRLKLKKAVPA